MSWKLSLIHFCWVSVQRLLLLACMKPTPSSSTSFWLFTQMHHLCQHDRQSLEAVSMSESSTLPLDDSELEEAASLVFMELPTLVQPSRPMKVALEGMEGLAGSCPVQGWDNGLISRANSGVSWARFAPCLNFCGADMGPLDVMMVKWTAGRMVSLSLGDMARKSEKGHPIKRVPGKEMSGRKDTGRGEVSGGGVRPPKEPRAGEPWSSGSDSGSCLDAVARGLDTVGMLSSCWAAMVTALLI